MLSTINPNHLNLFKDSHLRGKRPKTIPFEVPMNDGVIIKLYKGSVFPHEANFYDFQSIIFIPVSNRMKKHHGAEFAIISSNKRTTAK